MRILLISLCLLVPLTAAAGPVYRWVDADGVTHFSDRVPDDPSIAATREDIGQTAAARETRRIRAPAEAADAQDAAAAATYERVSLVSPANGVTASAFEGTMDVILDVQPPIYAEHVLRLYIDGFRRTVTPAPTIRLTGIEPGPHALFAEITDASGRLIARSATNRFTVRDIGEAP
jgi:hypothetical protein